MDVVYSAIHERMSADETAAGLRPTTREFIDTLRRCSIEPGGTALDAGCGGTLSLSVACVEHGFRRVDAIDQSEASLHHARHVATRLGQSRISLCAGSVMRLPFADGAFDFVVCSGVAHHTQDPELVVRELQRVIRPGGLLYVSLYCFARSASELVVRILRQAGTMIDFQKVHRRFRHNRVINNFVLDHMYVPILWIFSASEVRRMLVRHGLSIVDEWPSRMDPFASHGMFGRLISGDGLMRIWLCRKG